eukprot:CAMPEP_0198294746 /NCGR_PEP_ID=MMETSP1449-20131203/24103_1 /TAXON_ID=420275 /ORGANISM="Attheya septentrionalis, Strain CCMP2084" /LENGTH=530 /DNA_ID=CAMNT_0043994801 /DNA_START=132 /DNA_END=1722 /DNA_ORIENTATION=-
MEVPTATKFTDKKNRHLSMDVMSDGEGDNGERFEDNPLSRSSNGHDSLSHDARTPEEIKRHELFMTIAGIAGNVLEWYDFAVFGFFGDIIGDVFFPPQEGHAAIIESFAVFGGAFLMRPIGGVLMGYIGDTVGRKKALEISIFLMAIPTFCMGCLPGYNQVGWIAIVLLSMVRLLQGLSVGGQLVSSLVFTLEKHPKPKWGLYGAYVMVGANIGTLLGGLVAFALRSTLSDDALRSWGWRIPFLSGVLVSISGIYLKYYCKDDEVIPGHEHNENEPPNPIRLAFSQENRRSLLCACLVPVMWGGGFYLSFVWMAIFMKDLVVPPVPNAFVVNSCALFVSVCLLFPVAGILSDMYGRVKIMTIGGVGMGILGPVMIVIIGQGDPVAAFFAQSTLGVFLSLWGGPMCSWLVESFPPEARLTSVAIGYNIAQAMAGGISPSLATFLVDRVGVRSPGLLLSGLATLSLTGLYLAPTTKPPIYSSVEESVTDNEDTEQSRGVLPNKERVAPDISDDHLHDEALILEDYTNHIEHT